VRGKTAVVAGFVGGAVVGALLWSAQMRRSRTELFNASPLRRLAALSYLRGRAGLDTVRLLTDYVRWEQHPALRRRGERLLRSMQLHFD
jgi:hypothetical protein